MFSQAVWPSIYSNLFPNNMIHMLSGYAETVILLQHVITWLA